MNLTASLSDSSPFQIMRSLSNSFWYLSTLRSTLGRGQNSARRHLSVLSQPASAAGTSFLSVERRFDRAFSRLLCKSQPLSPMIVLSSSDACPRTAGPSGDNHAAPRALARRYVDRL